MTYFPGQRWVSHADSQLGLGIILAIEGRRISVQFPAVEEERTYAIDNAPLTRLRYKEGDEARTTDGRSLTVDEVHEHNHILYYAGHDTSGQAITISELELDSVIELTNPRQRLLNGHLDSPSDFKLRVATLNHLHRLQQSPVRGLLGSRTLLLPHQLYIAAEVSERFAPRVLLADEVGLGKTIEAGMVIHRQLLNGRAKRVLILVPPSLLHQWLVEMLRRFNLHFALYDAERMAQYETELNPFDDEQLILCSTDLFDEASHREKVLATRWDLIVVDEAHHLSWTEENGGDANYQLVEALAKNTLGLLLLTATPEQVGATSHFARLRLLDPDRFPNLADFAEQEQHFSELNTLLTKIEANQDVSALLPADIEPGTDKEQLISQLLDRHGTGRVLFRNTRAAVKGFPKRLMRSYPLPLPATYDASQLHPETAFSDDSWLDIDPRVNWLIDKLKALRPHKVLVICAKAATAIALEHHLHLRAGIRTAAFYEGLSIIERDRAAAYFADEDYGAQALVCSEIGSEGRNFQFAHHLVLFDLPHNPDVLEQRIGRLDRIGQTDDIHIHVPYLENSAQHSMLRWLNEGIAAFEHSFSAGLAVLKRFQQRLQTQLTQSGDDLDALIADTKHYANELKENLHSGRDRLLERSSCPPAHAQALVALASEQDNSDALQNYMETLSDSFGIEQEHHSEHAVILRPTENMLSAPFPGLGDDGLTATFNREQALAREDMVFFTWEHPSITTAMDWIVSSELGNATIGTLKLKGVPAGTLLLECFFTVHCSAQRALQVERFLPLSPMRFLIDARGKNLASAIPHERLNTLVEKIRKSTALAIVKQVSSAAEEKIRVAQALAEQELSSLKSQALALAQEQLGEELARLQALQRVNPNVREEEISHLEERIDASREHIAQATVQMQSLRLIVTT